MHVMKRILPILLILLLLPVFGVKADGEDKLMLQGDKGEEVVRVQTRLFDLGYYTYKPTGSFQTVTKSAVISYQVASGLMSDGSVGQETMRALFSRDAKRIEFHAQIPLAFSAQGEITQKGNPLSWKTVKEKLTPGAAYRVRNAATGEDVMLLFVSGENHADMQLQARYPMARQSTLALLTKWLGSTNSFYKCAVLFELDGQWIAASMQWDGDDRLCVYFRDSLSHVLGFPDAEHLANVKKASQ